jgi:hypothetical protein
VAEPVGGSSGGSSSASFGATFDGEEVHLHLQEPSGEEGNDQGSPSWAALKSEFVCG